MLLGFGFLVTLPLMLTSTPEERQHLTQDTVTMRLVEYHMGLFNVTKQAKNEIKTVIQEAPTHITEPESIWLRYVSPEIQSFGVSQHEARSIARLVWLYSQQYDLDPALVLALITIESRFDAFATSSVGARGLMQIMPFWKREFGSPQDNLFDAATNIRYGCIILSRYIKRYHSIEKGLAAYNGSKGRKKYPNKVFSQIKRFQL